MKIRISFLIIMCQGLSSFGQFSITGKIKDKQQNLLFATVQLLRPDSSLLRTVLTNNPGEFVFGNLAPGHYLISTSIVGYRPFWSPVVTIEKESISLPDIILDEAMTE